MKKIISILSIILFTNNLFAQTDSLKFDAKYGWFPSSNQCGAFQAMVLYCGLLKIDNSLTIKEKNQAFDYMMNWWFMIMLTTKILFPIQLHF